MLRTTVRRHLGPLKTRKLRSKSHLRYWLSSSATDNSKSSNQKSENDIQKKRRRKLSTMVTDTTSKKDETDIQKNGEITVGSMEKLLQFSKPEWPLIGASAATLAVTSSVTLLLPYASGQVIDITMGGDGATSPIVLAGGLFGLMSLSGLGVYFRTLWLARAGNQIVARLRQNTYQRMLLQDVSYMEQLSKGDFLSRLSVDSQLIQSAVTTQAVAALRSVVMSTGAATMLIYSSPTLAAVSLCTLPPIFISARTVGQQLQEKQQQVQEIQAEATSFAEQALTGIQTVKHFNAEGFEGHRYAVSIAQAHRKALETSHTQAQLESVTYLAANGAVLGVLGYGGTMVLDGFMTAGDLAGFVMYSFLMAGNLSSLSGVFSEVSRAVAASDRVMEVLEREPVTPMPKRNIPHGIGFEDSLHPPTDWTPESADAAPGTRQGALSVRIQNLDFSYPSRPDATILRNLNLSLQPGKSLSLVGGSGSGKSTVAALLTRMYEVPRRTVMINDMDLLDYPPEDLRQLVGVVSQEPVLFQGSIADNIRYGLWDASDEEVESAAQLAHVLDFVKDFSDGMNTQVGARGAQLSGGQRQRVAIARTLLKNPPLIILDEATSALDARSEYLVQKAINQLMQSDKTILSIAHRLSTIRNSDSIAVMNEGRVVQEGTFEELSSQQTGPFWELMKTQLIKDR